MNLELFIFLFIFTFVTFSLYLTVITSTCIPSHMPLSHELPQHTHERSKAEQTLKRQTKRGQAFAPTPE